MCVDVWDVASPLLVKSIAFYGFANLESTDRLLCQICSQLRHVASVQHANAGKCFCPLARRAISSSLTPTVCSAGAKHGAGVPYAIWSLQCSVSFKSFKLQAR